MLKASDRAGEDRITVKVRLTLAQARALLEDWQQKYDVEIVGYSMEPRKLGLTRRRKSRLTKGEVS